MSELLSYFEDHKQQMIDLLTEMIGYESFTRDKPHVDRLGNWVEDQFYLRGASSVTRISQNDVGDFMLAKWNDHAPGKPIMFLIHIDTVWPIGTLAERPVRIEDGILYGPGAVDMKGGITLVLSAIQGLRELNQFPDRPVWVFMTSDEEIGSIHSEPFIKEYARQASLVLVMEPGTKEGALKTWRKGIATYDIEIEGRPSHAGNAPEQGINSIIEFAQQALRLQALNDLKNGTSVNVTVVNGGTATNVIPAHTTAYVDTRMLSVQVMQELSEKILNLEPFIPGSKVVVKQKHQREPMEHDLRMQKTFAQAKEIGAKYGVTVREDGSGGGSDGNFTAQLAPTLDGMGPQGDGLHAIHEQVVISSLPTRATLIAGLLKDWVEPE